jgi:tetratricopeptide (TPR) repeat protein
LLAGQHRWSEAVTQLTEGRTILFLMVEQSNDPLTRHHLALCCAALGSVLREQGRSAESESLYCQAVSLHAGALEDQPPRLRERHALVRELHELSQVENDLRRPDQWEACLDVALTVLYELPPGVDPSTDRHELLATIHNDLGVYFMRHNRLAEAEEQLPRAIRQGESLVTRFPSNRGYALVLGGSYTNLGWVLGRTGRPQLALDWHRKALDLLLPVFQKEHDNSKAREFLRNTFINRAGALEALERFGEATPDWEWAARLTTGREKAHFLTRQASSLLRAGDVGRAVTTADEAAKEAEAVPGTLYFLASIQARAAAQYQQGKPERENCCAKAVELLRRAQEGGFFREADRLAAFKRDECFNLLRNRPDFRTIFQALE